MRISPVRRLGVDVVHALERIRPVRTQRPVLANAGAEVEQLVNIVGAMPDA